MVRGLAIRAKVVQAHLHGHDGWVRRLDAYLKHPQTGRALEHTWQGCSVNGPERSFFFDGRLQPSHRRIMAALSWPVRLWSMVMTNAQQAYTIGAGVLTWVGRRYKIKASLVNRYTNHNKPGKRKITIWRWYSSSIGASPLPIWYCPEATPPWTLTPWQAASLDAVWQRCCHLRQGSLVPTRTLNWLQFRIYSNSVLTHSQCISMKNIDFPVLIFIYIYIIYIYITNYHYGLKEEKHAHLDSSMLHLCWDIPNSVHLQCDQLRSAQWPAKESPQQMRLQRRSCRQWFLEAP